MALSDRDTEWTYADLGRAAAEITTEIQACGIEPGERVGVCLPRSKEAVAAMLGVWGARATYVPLDPEYPSARLRAMCERVGISVVIGAPGGSHRLGASFTVVDPSAIGDRARAGATDGSRLVEPAPEAAAYILFTSGSSGRPKAVEVAHESLTSVLEWVHATFSPDELAVTTTSISFSFDPFVLEVLGPLTLGGTVRVIPSALAIADLEPGVTLLANTPSVLSELWRAGRLPSTLKTIISGGETLSASLASGLLRDTSVSRLVNTYGPTEATVLATAHEVDLPVGEPVPIGRPLPGAGVVLLDDESEEVPCGTIGEICIFGPQVALGYVGDPEETALRFVEWTSDTRTRTRMYRTGDLGRRDEDGLVQFCGRKDRQLKLRGYRVEPGEIETALVRHPDVDQAVVICVGNGSGAKLVAYATGAAPALSSVDLHAWLQQSLPPYLVPAHVLVVDAFPVNANGKVAIDRLPPGLPARTAHDRPAAPPTEGPDPARSRIAAVARLAAVILDDEGPIEADDDFLEDLGGSSLALFQLLTAIEAEFSCRIEIGRILEDTTIGGLAALVGADSDDPRYLSVHEEGRLDPIYMIHAYLGTALRYRRLGRYLSADRPLVGIQVQAFDDPTSAARTSVEQMAEEAAAQIRALRPEGPYLLGGHSAGGLVAYEAARLLTNAGETVPLVVLLDSPVPRSPVHYVFAEAVVNWPDIRFADAAERRRQLRSVLESRWSRFRRSPETDRVGAAITSSYRASNLAVKRYRPGGYAGDVAVLSTRQGAMVALGKRDLGWRSVVRGQVTTIEIPGFHNTIFEEPQLEIVGRHLDRLVDQVDGGRFPNSADGLRASPTDHGDRSDTGRPRSSARATTTVPSGRSGIAI